MRGDAHKKRREICWTIGRLAVYAVSLKGDMVLCDGNVCRRWSKEGKRVRKEIGMLLGMLGGMTGLAQEGGLAAVAPKNGWDNLPPVKVSQNDWPWWRGPSFDNRAASGQKPPAVWGAGSNILWQVRLPGVGHSSPCVVGERIYITSGSKTQGQTTLWLFCLDRSTGRTVWQTEIYKGPSAKVHPDNSPVSSTSACDGERVFVTYQNDSSVVMAAVGVDGKIRWSQTVAPYNTIQGFSASPNIYKSAVIIPVEGPKGSYLTAFHRATGEVVWRTRLRTVSEGYAPAVVAPVAGREQLLQLGGTYTRGFDPESGTLLWECEGPAKKVCVATAAFDRDTVYATGGYPNRILLAIRVDGKGDVTKSHIRWSSDAKVGYVPSPLLHEGLLYAVADQGLLRCYDTADGRVLWERDFKAPFYSSPTLAGGKLYLFDRKGKGYIVPTGRTAGTIVTNELPSGVFATPVFLENRIYLRTLGDFCCIGEK